MTRPQTSAGMLERQSSREGNLLSPPTMTYDRPLRDRPLTGQVPRRRPRPSHETDLPSSPRSTIHPAPKVEAWAVTDKAVHEHVDASSSADYENERLRGELQSLQAALQHTQSALVDKYRGSGAKFVGGGQFRGSSENTRSKAGLDKKCGECAAAKALLRKAKLEAESLMITRRTLQADLSHTEAGLHQSQQQMAVTDLELEEISLSNGEMGGELNQMESALHAHHHSLHGWHEQAQPCLHSLHACTRSLLLACALCPLPLSHRSRSTPARRLRTVCNSPHPPTPTLLPLS